MVSADHLETEGAEGDIPSRRQSLSGGDTQLDFRILSPTSMPGAGACHGRAESLKQSFARQPT